MTSEDAELEFVITTQQLDGYGDEYYPAKVSHKIIHLLMCSVEENETPLLTLTLFQSKTTTTK